MQSNFDNAFALLIVSEGGYVNDPQDNGGETNWGVTKKSWADYLGRVVKDGEMKALTKTDVKPFYKKMYWDKCRCDDLPSGLDYAVFDFAVNAGTGQAARFLQRAVGVHDDGVIGSGTISAVKAHPAKELLETFSKQKSDFYRSIVQRTPSQAKFLNGWLNRVTAVETTATTMMA